MKIGLLGAGTIGFGVCEIVKKMPGMEIVKVLDRRDIPGLENIITHDVDDILNDPAIDTVVELLGGNEPAHTWAVKALKAGKNLVTANKLMVSENLTELMAAAREGGADFRFSAAVGGGIPFLFNLLRARRVDDIVDVGGILNGTTNYMLDLMQSQGIGYAEALKLAQDAGYAEADPTADVSGQDPLRKIMLACAVAYGVLPVDGLNREGIESLTAADVNHFAPKGKVCRLIAKGGKNDDGSVYAYVEPVLFPKNAPECSVLDNNNLAKSVCKYNGSLVMIGQGAGGDPTASNVLRDLINIKTGYCHFLPAKCEEGAAHNENDVHRYYVRADEKDLALFPAEEVEQTGDVYRLITAPIAVSKMHQLAADIRAEGRKVFFAAVAE